MKSSKLKLLLSFFFLLIAFTSSILYLAEVQFYKVNQNAFVSKSKMWSHRGVSNLLTAENSLKAIENAVKTNYDGIEIDVWFNNNNFYVSHDNLISDTTLQLSMVFEKYPDTKFWIDFKNLSFSNIFEVIKTLESYPKSKASYIIESKNSLSLGILNSYNFYTSLWLSNVFFTEDLTFKSKLIKIYQKALISIFKYNAVSTSSVNLINNSFYKDINHLNINCWTSSKRNSSIYQKLFDNPSIKLILDDEESFK